MKAWKDKKGCFSSVYPERQPFLMPDGLASRSSREERYVAARPYAHAVLPSGAAPIRASLCPAAERCSLVLSKNVGTYEPSFGSLCTVTFLVKRECVPANTSPPQGQKRARMGLVLGRNERVPVRRPCPQKPEDAVGTQGCRGAAPDAQFF